MISDDELIEYVKKGFIPGPREDEKTYLERIALARQDIFFNEIPFSLENPVRIKDWQWAFLQLDHLFGVKPNWVKAYFSSKKLLPWQGAMTWIIENPKLQQKQTLIQLRKSKHLEKICEVLAHEGVHAIRSAFDEPKFEEMFAYMTSSKVWRKIFGPIIEKPYEAVLFLSLLISGLWGELFFDLPLLFNGFKLAALSLLSLGLFRLARRRRVFNKTYKRLKSIVSKEKILGFMLCLTDDEIIYFSTLSKDELKKHLASRKNKTLRWRAIFLHYLKPVT